MQLCQVTITATKRNLCTVKAMMETKYITNDVMIETD